MKKVSIYLNGPASYPLLWRQNPSEFFLADGGLRHVTIENLGLASKVTHCGDFDSVTPLKQKKLEDACKMRRIEFSVLSKSDVDFSDFALILDTLAAKVDEPLFCQVFGGLCGALDHELVNILEAAKFVTNFKHNALFAFEPRVVVFKGEMTLDGVSVFSLIPTQLGVPHSVLIKGAEYEGQRTLLRPSHGLSNRVTAESLTLYSEQALIFEARTMKGEKDE